SRRSRHKLQYQRGLYSNTDWGQDGGSYDHGQFPHWYPSDLPRGHWEVVSVIAWQHRPSQSPPKGTSVL
ncbi:MAG TPA: hypothetical protein VK555_11130, partial [Terriglobales bacterium]|nr:hypothetical protein [Terriglobales bacterium]